MSLKGKLLLGLVPVIVISTVSLGYIAYAKLAEQKEHDIVRQVELVSKQIAIQSNSFVTSSIANSKLLVDSETVGLYLKDAVNSSPVVERRYDVLGLLSEFQSQFPEFSEINIYKSKTNNQCSASAVSSSLYASELSADFCNRMTNSAASNYSEFQFNQDNKELVLMLGQKVALTNNSIYNSILSNEETIGVVIFEVNTQSLRSAFLQYQQSSFSHHKMFDAQGRHVFSSDTDQIGNLVASASDLLSNTTVEMHHEEHDSHHGLVVLPDFKGAMALAHIQKLHNNLYYAGILPHHLLKVASHELIPSVLMITVLAILLTTATLWKLLNALILSPIRELQAVAILLGDGQAIPKPAKVRADEIGQLQSTFYEMSCKLEDSISELRQSNKRVEQLAYTDSLTGLPNRRKFLELLDTAIEEQKHASNDRRIGVFFLDVDEFKRINDLLGHEAGDMLLIEVGNRLTRSLEHYSKDNDNTLSSVVSRLGGDEFVVSVLGVRNTNEISVIASVMQDSLIDPIKIDKQHFQVSVSIGMAIYPDDGSNADEVLKSADIAMYDTKMGGKNGNTLFCKEMANKVTEKAQLEHSLRSAIADDELYLAYQPQVCARTNETLGVEALLRWNHPEKGNVPPDVFIPIAEEFGLIGSIGTWVLNEACEQWKAWSDAGIAPTRIAINVSPRQLSQIDLKSQVIAALSKHEMPATALELELTESCIMEAPVQMVDTIQSIRDLGVRIALDDFGTGYSSLALLASLPIDTIKLDRSFVTDVNLLSGNSSIVSAVLSLAQDLNLETVAEGVETESEKRYLQQRNCDILQGYLLSRPMDKQSADEWLSINFGQNPQSKVA